MTIIEMLELGKVSHIETKRFCVECGQELVYDEELEIGYCDVCANIKAQEELEDLAHPDSGKGIYD